MSKRKHRTGKAALKFTRCSGELSWKEFHTPIKFSVFCSEVGSVSIPIRNVRLTQETSWLRRVSHAPGPTVPYLNLTGHDEDGNIFESAYVYLGSVGTRSTPKKSEITLEASAAAIEIRRGDIPETVPASGAVVQYHTGGMKGFSGVTADSPVGRISIAAPSELDNYERMSGVISIEAGISRDESLGEWLGKCDDTVESVLEVFSLALGIFIRWSARRWFVEDNLVSTYLSGNHTKGSPREPLYSHLNLRPFLELAVSKYTPELKASTGIDVAIEWFLMEPDYIEAQFLAGMTALEHLVQAFVRKTKQGDLFPSEYFRKIVDPALRATLGDLARGLDEATPEREKILKAIEQCPIGNLNGKSLRVKIKEMLRAYEVPFSDLEDEIDKLIKTRNKIAHTGTHRGAKEKSDIHYQIGALREILKRIFMVLLGYKGQYYSSLNGLRWTSFPPEPS